MINRSQLGYRISYIPDNEDRNARNELFMGFIYANSRASIIPEAQGLVSDEDLKKGVKAYFLERYYINRETKKREAFMEIIPFAYTESERIFLEHLYDAAVTLAPRKNSLQRRRNRNHRPTQLAA